MVGGGALDSQFASPACGARDLTVGERIWHVMVGKMIQDCSPELGKLPQSAAIFVVCRERAFGGEGKESHASLFVQTSITANAAGAPARPPFPRNGYPNKYSLSSREGDRRAAGGGEPSYPVPDLGTGHMS